MSTDATGTGVMDTGVMDNCVVNAVASYADGYTHNYRVGSITGGHSMMKRVTGTGCMLSGSFVHLLRLIAMINTVQSQQHLAA